MRRILTMLFFVALAQVSAQETGSIVGNLTDKDFNDDPLAFANILIEGTTKGTTSDFDGLYEITDLEPGTYTVIYSFLGYETITKNDISVEAGKPTKKVITGLTGSLATGNSWNIGEASRISAFATVAFGNSFEFREGPAVDYTTVEKKRFPNSEEYEYARNTTAMANIVYRINDKHKIKYNSLFINDATDEVAYYGTKGLGTNRDAILDTDRGFYQSNVQFNQDMIFVNQLLGTSTISEKLKLDWGLGYNTVLARQPDRKRISVELGDVRDLDDVFTSQNLGTVFNTVVFNGLDPQNGLGNVNLPGNLENTYEGNLNVHALYVDAVYKINDKFSIVPGLRVEQFNQDITYDVINLPATDPGERDASEFFFLPSLNMKYALNEDQNLRFSFSSTVSNPEFKEVAPFVYEDVTQRIGVAAFAKAINNPVNLVVANDATGTQRFFRTGDQAQVIGFEVEIRKNLITNADEQSVLSTGFNATYTYTKQDLKDSNGVFSTTFDRNSDQLQGASPLLVNTDLSYRPTFGTYKPIANLVFSYFSDRIDALGSGQLGNIIEKGVPTLDFIWKNNITEKVELNASFKNILNPNIERVREVEGGFFAIAILLVGCAADDTADVFIENPNGENPTITPVTTNTEIGGTLTENLILETDTEYQLTSALIVPENLTLTINPGVVVKAIAGADVYVAILQGGKIMAEGTSTKPIVFTSGSSTPNAGDWGGLILLGKAPINSVSGGDATSTSEIGGLPYGGSVADDNSGIIKYVRVEYSGGAADASSENNGFSFYGVGSGTTIEYIQAFEGKDDGVEFFGGTVNASFISIIGAQDDSVDWTEAPSINNLTINGNGSSNDNEAIRLRAGTRALFNNVLLSGFAEGFDLDSDGADSPTGQGVLNGDTGVTDISFEDVTVNLKNDTGETFSEAEFFSGIGNGTGADYTTWNTGWTRVVRGNVSDKTMNNEPLLLANIQIKGQEAVTQTNFNGNFEISNLTIGNYTLIISYLGYETIEVPVTINENEVSYIDANLNTLQFDLEEVVGIDTASSEEKNPLGLLLCVCCLTFAQEPNAPKFGNGLFNLVGQDSTWSMKIATRMQFLTIASWDEGNDGGLVDPEQSFLVRRARLKFDGFAYSPKLKYKLELGLSNRDISGASEFTSNAPRYILDAVNVLFSSGNLQQVDRSLLNSRFNIDRDLGVQIRHHFNLTEKFLVREKLATSMGEGRNITTGNLGGLQHTARLELLPFGAFKSKGDYSGSDLKREETPKLMLAATFDTNRDAVKNRSNQGSYMVNDSGFYQTDINTIFLDAMFKYQGFSFMAEYATRSADDPIAKNSDGSLTGDEVQVGNGLNLQTGYLLKSNWEVSGRYTNIVLDESITGKNPESQYTLGLSKYIAGHKLKVQTDGALFGGVALSAITYFILMKGIKGTAYAGQSFEVIGGSTIKSFLEAEWVAIAGVNFVIWSILAYILMNIAKVNIYKLIIGVGTFALALAFAGNDLVNFVGVPIAAWQSYEAWEASGIAATEFSMAVLDKKVPTPTLLLFIAGIIMVATLWFSSKAKAVVKTSLDLSSQEATKERFQPNFLSRGLVRSASAISSAISAVLPHSWQAKIDEQFTTPTIELSRNKVHELPAFDMVRAAVNLMVAGILISIATSYKLPLSTTYVTFMVAMGTSLADRAWGAESAVYRVAGVLNVIGGWFGTAIIAFVASGTILALISFGKGAAIAILLFVAILLLARNYISHNKKSKEIRAEDSLNNAESSSIQGVIEESASNISNVLKRTNKIYTNSINGLAVQNLDLLKKNKKQGAKLSNEIDAMRDHIFYFIKNLDEASVGASNFYITALGNLTDIAQSLEYIGKVSHKHVNNNHKKLKYNQIKELKQIDEKLEEIFNLTQTAFDNRSFEDIGAVLNKKHELFDLISEKIQTQVARTRTEESSPKNTTLYFSLLLETKDLMTATMTLLEQYYNEHDSSIAPATIDEPSLALLASIISFGQQLTGDQLLDKAIEYHDPNKNWSTFKGNLSITMSTPDKKERVSAITLDLPKEYFQLISEKDGAIIQQILDKKECQLSLNGSATISEEDQTKFKLTCERATMYKNYYTYLYGLPMKLKDSGTIIDQQTSRKTFKGKEYLVLKASYDKGTSPVKQIPVVVHELDIGKFTFYPNIIVSEFKEGVHVDFENAAYPIQLAQMELGSKKPVIYISHRSNSYSWNPVQYRDVIQLFPNFKGFAIVAQNKRRRMIARLENLFIKKPIAVFDNMDAAIEWAEDVLAQHS
ncbi:hypothetical protein GQR58_026409 [Nymphon striatum]|nr:hypothetical protein GQR58_026409 [Nymphon striatum]